MASVDTEELTREINHKNSEREMQTTHQLIIVLVLVSFIKWLKPTQIDYQSLLLILDLQKYHIFLERSCIILSVYPTGQRPPKCFVPCKQTTKVFKMRDNMKTTTDIFNIYDPRSNLNTKIASPPILSLTEKKSIEHRFCDKFVM